MAIAYLVQSFITLWYDLTKWHMYIVLPFRQVMITAKYNLIYLTTGQWPGEGEKEMANYCHEPNCRKIFARITDAIAFLEKKKLSTNFYWKHNNCPRAQ